jgi:hypothetical protein
VEVALEASIRVGEDTVIDLCDYGAILLASEPLVDDDVKEVLGLDLEISSIGKLKPSLDVSQVNFPGPANSSQSAFMRNGCVQERDEINESLSLHRGAAREKSGANCLQIIIGEAVCVDHGETVDERCRKTLSATTLVMGVLGCKKDEIRMSLKCLIKFSDINLLTVIQTRVESLENGL